MTNKKIIFIAVLVLLIGGILLVSEKKTDTDRIKVGVLLPLTGQYGAIGESARDAILLAAKDNPGIEIVIEDTAFDSKKGVSAYQKLTSIDNVDAIVNLDSPTLNAIQPLADQDGTLVIQLSETEIHKDDSVFQMMPFSYPLFTTLAEEADERYDRIALVYGGTLDIFVTNAEYFRKGISSDQIVYEARINSDADIRTEVTKLLASNPEATTLILDKDMGIKFVNALKAQKGDKDIKLICDANAEFVIGDYIAAVGSEILEGCISTNLPDNATESFKNAFKAEYDRDPLPFSDYSYDAIELIEKLQGSDEGSWQEILQDTKIEGASGTVTFDETGTRHPAAEVHIFVNGAFIKEE